MADAPFDSILAYDIAALRRVMPIRRSSIYNEIKAGRLRASKLSGRTIFLAADIATWLAAARLGIAT